MLPTVERAAITRYAMAHDASHYLMIPSGVATPATIEEVRDLFTWARDQHQAITFRSGGTSLSGQASSTAVLVDSRRHFRDVRVSDNGRLVSCQPGATVRQVNARLARHGRKIGPDPASEIACTIGGVVANNSSGMLCGITENTYQTLDSLIAVLPSGTILDTSAPDASAQFRVNEPAIYDGLRTLRARLLSSPSAVATIRRLFAMKNTMGYSVNALLDFTDPVDILAHLIVGSEGTLAFVAEATYRTIPVLPHVATTLLVFSNLEEAAAAVPLLVKCGFATVELLDAESLRVAQHLHDVPAEVAAVNVREHAALLVELHDADSDALTRRMQDAMAALSGLPLTTTPHLTRDSTERAALWHLRKGLYTSVAGARPSGTTALLEDIVVPLERLAEVCKGLQQLFAAYNYERSVIFGHAKDGNIHFMLNEHFDDPNSLDRYQRFTRDMIELVLTLGGSLKAEHGTGRIMAPFMREQYGDEITDMMYEIKALIDPANLLNPGVLLNEDPASYLGHLKTSATVQPEVDKCVECGYCEPTCPSKDLTLTPRQRIVLQRDIQSALNDGDTALAKELTAAYDYDGIQTCAADGMCQIACPVGINTGDLVRKLRAEKASPLTSMVWSLAAKHWGTLTRTASTTLDIVHALPAPLTRAATTTGRSILGSDNIPTAPPSLPKGGSPRQASQTEPNADIVFFPSCMGAMFAPAEGGMGSAAAFLELAKRAGINVYVPDGIDDTCCGTPWKSKGHTAGYDTTQTRTLTLLQLASENWTIPIVSDGASCTEGLHVLIPDNARDRIVDSVAYTAAHILPKLLVGRPMPSLTLHPTCSTSRLGINRALETIGRAIAREVVIPEEWGCCAFAGDRGLLHPELTASATHAEAAEVTNRPTSAYCSANRTCELGMTEATGKTYLHILELLESATRRATQHGTR